MIVAISMFLGVVESLCNRITCEFSEERACGCARSGCLKPASPLRDGEVGQLKPPSPLRVRNGGFGVFSAAEVSSVSTLAVQGLAVVMVVSRWSASAAAEVSLVSTSPRRCVLCAKFVALRGLMGVQARNSSPCAGLGCSAAHEVGCGGGFAPLGAGCRRVGGVSWF